MLNVQYWAGEMEQWIKELAAKSDDLSSLPWTHVVEEER